MISDNNNDNNNVNNIKMTRIDSKLTCIDSRTWCNAIYEWSQLSSFLVEELKLSCTFLRVNER